MIRLDLCTMLVSVTHCAISCVLAFASFLAVKVVERNKSNASMNAFTRI